MSAVEPEFTPDALARLTSDVKALARSAAIAENACSTLDVDAALGYAEVYGLLVSAGMALDEAQAVLTATESRASVRRSS